jgi:multicomponent Na+:H+ antiporter subunit C
MEILLAFLVGGLYAAGLYLMLGRSIGKLIVGLVLISQAANLLIRARPPIIPEGALQVEGPFADPIPQALILTAIVIGFGVLAFALVLVHRVFQGVGTYDLDEMRSTDHEAVVGPDRNAGAEAKG